VESATTVQVRSGWPVPAVPAQPFWSEKPVYLFLLVSIVYFLAAEASVLLAFPLGPTIAYWPGDAILIAVLVQLSRRKWPAAVAGIIPATLLARYLNAGAVDMHALASITGNSLQVMVVSLGIRWQIGRSPSLRSSRNMAVFIFWAAIVGPVISAACGALTYAWLSSWGFYLVGQRWFFQDALPALSLAPLLMVLLEGRNWHRKLVYTEYIEAGLMLLGVVAIALFTLSSAPSSFFRVPLHLYALLPLLLWSAIRFGIGGTAASLLVIDIFTIWGALKGTGPFRIGSADERMLQLNLFLVSIAVPALLLSSAMEERRQKEKALRHSEHRYAMATSSGATGVWDLTLLTGELYIDPGLIGRLGFKMGEIPDASAEWSKRVHPDDLEVIRSAVMAHIKGQSPTAEAIHRMIHKDGSLRWILSRGTVTEWYGGRALRMTGTSTDVTEQRRIEDELRRSEERFRDIVEQQTDLICRYLPDTTITFVNQAYCRYFGKSQAELVGTKFLSLIPDPARQAAWAHVQSLMANPRMEPDEHQVIGANGEIRWQQWVDRALRDDNGKIVEFQAVGRDITQRKRAELELREAEGSLRILLEGTQAVPWQSQPGSWTPDYIGPQVERLLGYQLDQWYTPDFWLTHIHPEDREWVPAFCEKSGRQGDHFEFDYRMIRADGRVIWVHHIVSVERLNGQPVRLRGYLLDATQRRIAEIALREREDALRKSHLEVQELAGRLIHSQEEERRRIARELHDGLSQELAAISIGLSRLKKELQDNQHPPPESLLNLQEKMLRLAQDVRELSHSLHPAVLEHVGLVAALQGYCDEFQTAAGIRVNFTATLEAEEIAPEKALGLYRITQEALQNVGKHSRASEARVTLERDRQALLLEISDNGVGFDPQSATRMRNLGLASMQERARLLGGMFDIQSKASIGTTISVRVP